MNKTRLVGAQMRKGRTRAGLVGKVHAPSPGPPAKRTKSE